MKAVTICGKALECVRWPSAHPREAAPPMVFLLALQGEDDDYATMEQLDRIAAGAPDVDLVKLADCRHSPHKDQPQAVLEVTRAFVERLLDR